MILYFDFCATRYSVFQLHPLLSLRKDFCVSPHRHADVCARKFKSMQIFQLDCYLLFWYAFLLLFLFFILAMQNCRLFISSAHSISLFLNNAHPMMF